ncbi:hypothetical protein C1645_775887, partial [Glomus cerebriforme]
MALIFLELIKIAITIKKIQNSLDLDFKKNCISIFNRHWKQFDINIYFVALFFHPKYQDKDLKDNAFCEMCL